MDNQLFDRLLRRDLAKIKAFVRKISKNEDDAEEIFQETLIAATISFKFFEGKSSFCTWMCGIAKHEVGDYYRKRRIKQILFSLFPWLEEVASQALGPEQVVLQEEYKEKIKKAMSQLSEGYQEVLRLKYYQGLSIKEIARKSNESTKAIESRLTRARKAFAKVYLADSSSGSLSVSG